MTNVSRYGLHMSKDGYFETVVDIMREPLPYLSEKSISGVDKRIIKAEIRFKPESNKNRRAVFTNLFCRNQFIGHTHILINYILFA